MTAALRRYYSPSDPPAEFVGRTPKDVIDERDLRLRELDHLASLALLAAVEAAVLKAYGQRPGPIPGLVSRALLWLYSARDTCSKSISRTLRNWLGDAYVRPRLEDVVDLYFTEGDQGCKAAISGYRGAILYRHRLAHGRYWEAKLQRPYEFSHIYDITTAVFEDVLGRSP